MVFNRNKNWTFRRLIKTNDNLGAKIFLKLAKSVENRFKSNEPMTDNPVRMSDLNVSMDSLKSSSKTSPVKSFKTEKSVHFDINLEDYQPKRVEPYLELCKVKVYVTPSVERVTTVEIHNDQRHKYSGDENYFKEGEDCFRSFTSLQDLSGSSTYLTTEDVSGINESLQTVFDGEAYNQNEFPPTFEDDLFEKGEEMDVAIEIKQASHEDIEADLHDMETDSMNSSGTVGTVNLPHLNSIDANENEETEVSLKENSHEEHDEAIKLQGPEDIKTNLYKVEIDLVISESESVDEVNRFQPNSSENEEFGETADVDGVVERPQSPAGYFEGDTPNEFNILQPKPTNMEKNNTDKNEETGGKQFEFQSIKVIHCVSKRVEEDSSKCTGTLPPNSKDLNVDEDNERKSLVKNMVKLFNENVAEKRLEQWNHHHDALDEIAAYPWNLVRQRIDQFSQEYAEIDAAGQNEETHISHSLVQQRIQQLLADANMQKIFTFRPSECTATQARDPQTNTENSREKSVQTQTCRPDFDQTRNSRTFIRNLQLLLNLHQTNDETDDDSDSLENSDHRETVNSPNFLPRSFVIEDLSNLEAYKGENSEHHDEFISNSDDAGDEKVYSLFAEFAREQSSPSIATPDHYEVIPESEAGYLTPVDVVARMSEEDSAARRNEDIAKKFVTNLYEGGQRSSCVGLKKPADYKIIHSENELHIKDEEAIGDKKHVNYGSVNKHSSESDSGMSRRVDSVNVGGNNCIDVEVPTEFCPEDVSLEASDTEADRNLMEANGGAKMEEDIYASVEDDDDGEEKRSKTEDEIYFALKHDADVQGIIMQQASKALELCRNSRSFLAGKELVEAERILLVATCKYELLRREIQKDKYDSFRPRTDRALGDITIDNLFLQLQLNEEDFTCYNHYFILVLSSQDTVFSTKVVEGNPMNYANFEDAFTFRDLPSDFTITVDIYGLKLKKAGDKNRPGKKKFKTKNKLENVCPRKRVFYKDLQTVTLVETSVAQSSFALCGSVTVTLEDVGNPNWPIKNPCNVVSNKMNLSVSVGDVRIEGKKKGFLTVGSEVNGHLAWNRRWCVLDGPILKFFNYPGDEDLVRPTVTLDFRHCSSGEIEICDKERCAKSRTMLLKTRTILNGASESVGHFLSADSRNDLLEWQSKINSIVGSLAKWNQLSCVDD